MPFVAAPAPATQSTGGGGFRAAGAFLAAEPPKWKPDVLAALPKRTVGWLGESGLPVVGEYQGDDVVLYPAPTEQDPAHKLFLRAPKAARPPGPNAWPYEKREAAAERGKPRPGGAVDVLDRDPKTGEYREAGLLFAGGRREVPDADAATPAKPAAEIDDFVRRRETLELLKGRNPEKFSRAMQLYERYAAYRDGSPTLAKPIGERALKLFQEIMPEGDYERWLSERKLVERGDWNPPQVVWKDREKKSLTLKPSETRGRWSGEVGIPVEELLQAEDVAARQTAAGEEISDNALARFGQRGALGLRRLSQGLNRVLNPFVSDETLDEVGRTTDALSAAAAARSGPVGRALGQAAESLGTMAGGAAAGTALGPAALPAAMAAAAGTSSYDQAYREATEAGLRGGERTEYALQQAGWETVPSLVFSHVLKIPGVEGILSRSAVNSRTLGRVLKDVALQAGISGAEEVPEEVVTAIGQNLTAKFSGVDPERGVLTPDELVDVVAQSFITAGLLTGVRNAPAIARSAFGAAADPEAAPQQPGAPVGGAPPTPPAAAATADTTDFIPTDLGDATNVGGLAQASPQVKWSQGVAPQQVQPADGGGKTAELPLAALAGDTAAVGATPTPDPLRKLAPVPQGTAAVAAWAKQNPEAAARVLAATKEGAPLTREQMATLRLGLKSGGADARAAFVKELASVTQRSELPSKITGFTTAQGSTYVRHEDGTTTRTKARRSGHDAADVGEKERSNATYFVSPEAAREIGMWQTSSASGKRVVVENGKAVLVSINPKTGEHGVDGRFELSETPVIGSHPLELWDKNEKGWYRKNHPGSAITSLSEIPPDAAEPAPPQAEVPSPQPAATPPEAPQAVKPPPPPPVLETAARDALRKYAVESGLSEKLLPMDTEYQRLKALADAERRSNLAKEGVVTKRAKLAEREQAQRDVAAGKVDRENVQYAPLHEVEPELRNRIQAEAVRLLGETDSANTRKALEKIIQDAGADTGAAVEKQKERIVGILTGEVDQRTVWEKKFVAPRPADPVVQLLLIPQGDRGVILRAAQRSVVDGKPDGLALWAKDLAETELNAGGTLDDPFVPAGEDQILAKIGELADVVGASLPEGDVDFDFGPPPADDERFGLERETAGAVGPEKFDNAEGEQRRMFSGMDALPGQEDLFEGLDKPAEVGEGMRSEESRRGPNPFRRITPKESPEAQAATETRSERSAGPNPFRRQPPRAKRATRSEESTRSEASSGSTGRQYGQGREASAAGKLGPGVLKPLPMPELIQLARELLGKLPQIRKRMGQARGRFQYRPGSRLFDILIRADVPRSEQDVAEVLAHELGHLIDYLPDNALTRGNILGRIASLRGYLKDYLAGTEGGPGPLTADDEKRLRDEAKRLLSTTAEEEVDEEIRTTTPITPADVLAIWNAQDTSGLDPGLLTYIKRATAAEKKSIILQAMKGIVPADLQKFAKEIVTKTGKKIKRAVPGKTSAADVAAKLKELIAEEIRKRRLLSAKVVRDEVMAVSEWWRPFDRDKASADDIKYRESSKELYADALSVLLNSPGELEARAPEFWRGFTAYADKKPEFLKAYLELQSILAGDDATVAARRRENIQAMFASGDEQIRASATAARAARLSVIETVKQFLGQYLLNRNAPLNVRAAKAKREGVAVRTAENAEYMLDEFFRADNANHVFLTDVQAQVHRPLLDAGLSRDDLGEYLFLKRVLNERHEIANPLGFNPTESAKQLADLEKRLGKDRFAALEASAAKFHDLVYDVAAAATVAGYYSTRTFNDVVKPNRKNYAAFAVVKYLEDTVSPAIKEQVGTFEDIANPFDATVMKIMAVNRMIELNKAKVAARDLLLRAFPQDITPTPIAYKQREPSKPAPHGKEYLYVFENGKPAAYAVPSEIAKSFQTHDVGGIVRIFNVIQSAVYKVFHPLYVTLSPGFQAANPFKDLRRTLVNLPAAAKAKGVRTTMREILTEYVKAIPTSYRRAAGIDDTVLREMMETKALDTPFADMDLESPDKGQYERLLEKHGITDAEAKSRIGRVLQAMGNLVSGVGVFQETLTKVAAFNLLKKKGLGDKETSYIVRKYVGTPDYKQRGLATAVTNSLWMYSKVKWNGLQADLRLAGNPTTAAGWWWRAMLSNVLPTWTYRLALAGAFGPTVAAMFQRIPKYFLDNYDVIPLGFVGGGDDEEEPGAGKVAFFTIPKDETGRLLSALASSMFDVAQEMLGKRSKSGGADKAAGEAARELQAGVLPDLNPLLDIAWKWSQYAAGVNPVDHTGRAIVPRDEWTAGGWDASKMLLTWTSDKFGVVSDLMKWAGRDKVLPSRFRGADGGELNAPWYTEIPGLSRLIRVSDYGLREDEWTEIENEEQERARFRIGLGETIRGATSERYALSRRSTLGALDDPEALRLFHLNSWYAHTYLPLTDEIRELEADGGDGAELRKKLDDDTALATAKQPPPTDAAARADYLRVHGQSIGSLLLDATSPRPEQEKREKGDAFAERKKNYQERRDGASRLIDLLDLTPAEKQRLLKEEAKRRGYQTNRWEGEYKNRRTAFGVREAKLNAL